MLDDIWKENLSSWIVIKKNTFKEIDAAQNDTLPSEGSFFIKIM